MQPCLHEKDHPNVSLEGVWRKQVPSCSSSAVNQQAGCRLLYVEHSQANLHLLICMAVESNSSSRMRITSTTDKKQVLTFLDLPGSLR